MNPTTVEELRQTSLTTYVPPGFLVSVRPVNKLRQHDKLTLAGWWCHSPLSPMT